MTAPSLQLVRPSTQVYDSLAPIARAAPSRHAPSVYLASLSKSSRRSQKTAIVIISTWLNADADWQTLPWARVRHEHVAAVRARLIDDYSSATARRMLAALRGVIKACWRLEQIDGETRDRALDVPPIRGESLPKGRALSRGDVRALFDECADDPTVTGVRDAAMFAVLFGAGVRRFELAALKLDDYDSSDGALSIQRGKGAKGRVVYLGEPARDAVNYWLEFRGQRPGALIQPVTRSGRILRRHLCDESIARAVRDRAAAARLKRTTPHDGRRTVITNLLESGVDVLVVQRIAGHASADTTGKYDRRGEASKKSASDEIYLPFSRPRSAR